MRELGWMADARQRDDWTKVSHLMASALNSNPWLQEPYKAEDFDPYASRKPVPSADGVLDFMRADGFFNS